jgi:hypothetical protein
VHNILESSLEFTYSQTRERNQETPQIESEIVHDQDVMLEINQEILEPSQGNEQLEESIEKVVLIRRSSRKVRPPIRL